MRDEALYLLDAMRCAQKRLSKARHKVVQALHTRKKPKDRNKVGSIKKCHDKQRRRQQLMSFQEMHETRIRNEQIQIAIDNAVMMCRLAEEECHRAKMDFDYCVLYLAELQTEYSDNFAVQIKPDGYTVSICFGGEDGDPFGRGHGHYVIDLDFWRYTYRREVGEPHCAKNHIDIALEISC